MLGHYPDKELAKIGRSIEEVAAKRKELRKGSARRRASEITGAK
jgi:hypothetical protein